MSDPSAKDSALALLARLDAIEARLAGLETGLVESGGAACAALAERLRHEEAARRALAEQTAWLIEVLGDARREVRWLQQERKRLMAEPGEA